MKRIIFFLLLGGVFPLVQQAQNWTQTEFYDFNASDLASHDNTWGNGMPWGYTACSSSFYPACRIGNELEGYNLNSVSNSLNNNIKYNTISGRSCVQLIARNQTFVPYPSCPGESFNFSSASMWRKINTYSYGKYEICCRIPKWKGCWPAFWLLGPAGQSGEIDIMEVGNTDNLPPYMTFNIHNGYYNSPNDISGGITYDARTAGIDLSADFHIYSLEWSPNQLRFLIDNKIRWIISPGNVGFFPTGGNMTMILNLAIGNATPPDAQALLNFPASLDVDYIKVYTENCPSYVLCNGVTTPPLTLADAYDIDIAAPYNVDYDGVNMTNPWSVPGGAYPPCGRTANSSSTLSATAANRITMHDGFIADAQSSGGVVYLAQIAPCPPHRISFGIADMNLPNETKQLSLTVVPNPTNGSFRLGTNTEDNYVLSIWNTMGEKVEQCSFSGKTYAADLSHLPPGIYMLNVNNRSNTLASATKIIISR